MSQYDPRDEHKVDSRSAIGQVAIKKGQQEYTSFYKKFRFVLDMENPESVFSVYEDAKDRGLLSMGKDMRELFFGKDIHFYGVCYLWDHCIEKCSYCPGSITNRANKYKARQITVEEAIKDTKAVISAGHTHICYLTGEDPQKHPTSVLAKYLSAIDELDLNEIILNIDSKTTEEFRLLRASVQETPLQFRVFQETYDRQDYKTLHPISKGKKWNYDFRRQSQKRALEAGFDNVGIGVLFGLHRYPLEEIEGLHQHSKEIEAMGKIPARICLPSANFMDRIGVSIPFILPKGNYTIDGEIVEMGPYEHLSELLYALAKLSTPHINLVSSERDPKGLLKRLDYYASCTTLNVHPGVGDNLKHHKGEVDNEIHFEQAISFSRNPAKTIEEMRSRGFNPIIKKHR